MPAERATLPPGHRSRCRPNVKPWPCGRSAGAFCAGLARLVAVGVGRLRGDLSRSKLRVGSGGKSKPQLFVDSFAIAFHVLH